GRTRERPSLAPAAQISLRIRGGAVPSARLIRKGGEVAKRSRAARAGREPCGGDGLPFEAAQVDDRRRLAGHIRESPCPPFGSDEDRGTVDDACAGREIGCR